jgi:hypothetical protein
MQAVHAPRTGRGIVGRAARLAGGVAVALLGVPLAALPASAAHAASCHGGAASWLSSASRTDALLPNTISGPDRWTTTSRCTDINFRVAEGTGTFSADVRVCFVDAGYCQSSWKRFGAGDADRWRVIASDVRDGTTFRIQIHYRFVPVGGQRYSGKAAF